MSLICGILCTLDSCFIQLLANMKFYELNVKCHQGLWEPLVQCDLNAILKPRQKCNKYKYFTIRQIATA